MSTRPTLPAATAPKTPAFSSATHFLATSAISFVVIIAILLAYSSEEAITTVIEKHSKSALAALSLLVLISYPVGYVIQALSFFSLHTILCGLEAVIFGRDFLLKRTKVTFDFTGLKEAFGVNDYFDFFRISRILKDKSIIFRRYDIDKGGLSAMTYFVRNLSFVSLIAIPYIGFTVESSERLIACGIAAVIFALTMALCVSIRFYAILRLLFAIRDLDRVYFYSNPLAVSEDAKLPGEALYAMLHRLSQVDAAEEN